MKKSINIREIAKLANVSVASVSRALKNDSTSKLSASQREHILKICSKYNYAPNEHTRRLFSKKANTAAIFFPPFGKITQDSVEDYIDINFGTSLMGAQAALRKQNIDLLLTEVTTEFLETKRYLSMIRGKVIDGILLWGVQEKDEYIKEILAESIPIVMLATLKSDCSISVVHSDDYTGMFTITEQVISLGHTKIAIAQAYQASSIGQQRLAGVIDALAKHNLKPYYITKNQGFGYTFGLLAGQEILKNAPETTCIIASNDMAAYGCIDELKKHDIKVPQNISVTGADCIKIPGSYPPINSFAYPAFDIGYAGANLLLEHIAGKTEIQNICLPTQSITGSTLINIKDMEKR